jgi:signal peptidase II
MLALILCLGVEYGLLQAHPAPGVMIPGLLDLRFAWNHGVSFSLFRQDSLTGSRILSAGLLALVAILSVLAWGAQSRLAAAGLGAIIGGALANLADRQLYGAVFDFLALHIGTMPLFVCNAADIAISVGVILLAWDALRNAAATQA